MEGESSFKPFYADRLTGTIFAKYLPLDLSVSNRKTPLAQVTESVNLSCQVRK